jgi:MerR family transcriptional regulator, redox-sensitive transcriptional activator SoxR
MLTISEVGRRVGLRASAIRHYEKIGIIRPAHRVSGQRRYDEAALYLLATLQRARQIGFTLEEIRQLFFGFRDNARPSERWKELSQRKLLELEQLVDHAKAFQRVLRDQGQCGCVSLEECGKRLVLTACSDVPRDVRRPNPLGDSLSRKKGRRRTSSASRVLAGTKEYHLTAGRIGISPGSAPSSLRPPVGSGSSSARSRHRARRDDGRGTNAGFL